MDTTRTSDGVLRGTHTNAVGDHVVYLEKTDDTASWGPGHADWVCERCGRRGETTTVLHSYQCEQREEQDG